MKFKQLGLLLLCFISMNLLFGQESQDYLSKTDQQRLHELANIYEAQYKEERERAIEIAKQNERPIKIEKEDGQIIELQGLTSTGQLKYYATNNLDAAKTVSTDQVWPGGSLNLNLTGNGITVGEWDGGAVYDAHQDLTGRVTQVDGATNTSSHATHVAGTMIGQGINNSAKGMAYQANLDAHDWSNDNSEMATAASNGLLVSNHSYGIPAGWSNGSWNGDASISSQEDYKFGFYTQDAKNWDQIARNAPYYLIVKSSGNDRNDDGSGHPADGPYDCISTKGNAKNILTVGAVKDIPSGYSSPSDVQMTSFSSWGPTDDGRIKPDVVGNGRSLTSTYPNSTNNYNSISGTSMSAPNVSGSLLLLQEHYYNLNNNYMKAATLKGLVIHTADDASNNQGPDYEYGWGLLNTSNAADLISDNGGTQAIEENSLSNQDTFTYSIYSDGTKPLRATISWTDVPGNPPAPSLDPSTKMLVNDLDARIIKDSTNNVHKPYVMDPANPSNPATKGDNATDNVEQVNISNPSAGWYTVRITHKNNLHNQNDQNFSLIISGGASSCPKPSNFNVSGISTDSAYISWNPGDTADNGHILKYGNAGFSPLSGGNTIRLFNQTNAALTGLSSGTSYDVYVKEVCTNGDSSSFAGPVAFTTACGNSTIPSLQTFTGNFPNCWSSSANGDVTMNNNCGSNNTYTLQVNGATGAEAVSNVFQAGNFNSLKVSYDFRAGSDANCGDTPESSDSIDVDYWDGNQWVQLTNYQGGGASPSTFTKDSFIISNGLTNNFKLRFQIANGSGVGYDNWNFDNIKVEPGPSCPPVSNVSVANLGTNSATLNWNSAGSNNKWEVAYGNSGFGLGNGTLVGNINNPSYTFSGLNPNTDYDFYIREICAPGDTSSYFGPFTVTTTCANSSLPYLNTFSSTFPNCWSRSNSNEVTMSNTCGSNNTYTLKLNGANGAEAITNNIDLSGNSSVKVAYKYRSGSDANCDDTPESGDNIDVDYWNGSQWVQLANYDGGSAPNVFTADDHIISSGITSSFKLRFQIQNGSGVNFDNWNFDSLEVIPFSCPPVNNLSANLTGPDSAIINWNSNNANNQWQIQYGISGFNLGNGTVIGSLNKMADTIGGLNPNTTYHFYVKEICGPNDQSIYQGPVSVYTGYCDVTYSNACNSGDYIDEFSLNSVSRANTGCNGNTNNYELYTSDTIVLNQLSSYTIQLKSGTQWNNGMGVWLDYNQDFAFGANNEFIGSTIASSAGNPTTITFTVPDTVGLGLRQLRVRSTYNSTPSGNEACTNFSYGETEDYVVKIDPPASCPPVSNIAVNQKGHDSAVMDWNSNAQGNNWKIAYGNAGFSLGNGTVISNIANTNYTLTGLNAGTQYDVYIQEKCGPNDSSNFKGPFSFFTECKTITAPNTQNFDAQQGPNLPFCWDKIDLGNEDLEIVSSTDHGAPIPSSPYAVELNDGNISSSDTAMLVSPQFKDLPSGARTVKFEAARESGGTSESLIVGLLADPNDASTFKAYDTINHGQLGTGFQQYTIQLTDKSIIGNREYIGFMHGPGAYEVYIDNIVYECIDVSLNTVNDQCVNGSTVMLQSGDPDGFSYTGKGVTGNNFDPGAAGVGSHDVHYYYQDSYGCSDTATQSVVVNAKPNVNLGSMSDVCENTLSYNLSSGSPSGGNYFGNGISGNTFDPSTAGTGTHTIGYTYTNANGCSDTAYSSITVKGTPTASFNSVNSFCEDAATIDLNASPPGGNYFGNGIQDSSFNPGLAGAGSHTLSYTITGSNGCTDTATQLVDVNPVPNVNLNNLTSTVCENEGTINLSGGAPSGGNYYGTHISSNKFNPSQVGVGVYDVNYVYTNQYGCNDTANSSITVEATPNVYLSMFNEICTNESSVTLNSGSPSGGSYFGNGVNNGNFDPQSVAPGKYQVNYTYQNNKGCRDTASNMVTVHDLPSVSLSSINDFCANKNAVNLSHGNPSGGYYWGAAIQGNTFQPSSAGTGTHQISYAYTDTNGCADTVNQNVTVNAAPDASMNSLPDACISKDSLSLQGFPSGGSYVGTGVSGDLFKPQMAGPGNHTVQYIYTNNHSCRDTAKTNLTVHDLPPVSLSNFNDACANENAFILDQGAPKGGVYQGNGVNNGKFDPAVVDTGFHPITYTYTDSNSCRDSITKPIKVNSAPNVTLSSLNDRCSNDSTIKLSKGSPSGGQYFGNGVTNNSYFNPSMAGVGIHNIGYAYSDNNGCADTSMQSIVVNEPPVSDFSTSKVSQAEFLFKPDRQIYTSYKWHLRDTTINQTQFVYQFPNPGTYEVMLDVLDGNGCNSSTTDSVDVLVGFADQQNIKPDLKVHPNPFQDQFTIDYQLSNTSSVVLEVYDGTGKRITRKVDETQSKGKYQYRFQPSKHDFQSGIYVVRMIMNGKAYEQMVIRSR